MIISISKDGTKRRCIFTETALLVSAEEEKLIYELADETLKLKFKLAITFSDEGEENTTSGSLSDEGKTINITLHKWNSVAGVETTKAVEYTAKTTGKKVWIKFKTWADKKHNFRSFTLTVWGEE